MLENKKSIDTCNILIKNEWTTSVISRGDLVNTNFCVNWKNANINFKAKFIEEFDKAINMVFKVGEITGTEIERGIDILTVLNKIGALLNKQEITDVEFDYMYSKSKKSF